MFPSHTYKAGLERETGDMQRGCYKISFAWLKTRCLVRLASIMAKDHQKQFLGDPDTVAFHTLCMIYRYM